jgi:hypothetical protein
MSVELLQSMQWLRSAMQKRVLPRGLRPRKNPPPMLPICHLLPPCLRGRSLSPPERVAIISLNRSLLFASNVLERDQRSALFVLVIRDCQNVNAWKCTRTPGPSADTSSTSISSRSQITCTVSATFVGKADVKIGTPEPCAKNAWNCLLPTFTSSWPTSPLNIRCFLFLS